MALRHQFDPDWKIQDHAFAISRDLSRCTEGLGVISHSVETGVVDQVVEAFQLIWLSGVKVESVDEYSLNLNQSNFH